MQEFSVEREVLNIIIKRRLKYVGHANRNSKTDLMTAMLQGKVESKRNRGRPPISYMNNITASSGLRLSEIIHRSRDRDGWRALVASTEAATFDPGDADK